MNDIHAALDRLRGSIVADVDQEEGFERLRRRKDHRATRRRVAAAATAMVIAAASTGVLIRAFDQPDPVASNRPTLPAVEPHEITTIPVGPRGQVSAITSGFGSVWVAAYGVPGGQGISRDAILRLDPATNEVTETIPVETVPAWETGGGGLTTGFGSLWVAGQRLLRIDPQTSAVVATIPLSALDGASDVAVNDTAVWVVGPSGDGSGVTKIDPGTNKVTGETSLRAQTARHVVATDTAVVVEELEWAHNAGPCSVLASVDPADAHLIAEEPARGVCSGGGSPFAWDGDVWAADAVGFAKVDPARATAISSVTPYADGGFPRGDAAVGASGVWFGAYPGGNGEARDTLSRFDPWGGRIDTYPLKVGWSAASVLGDTIWAMNFEGTVTRIDIAAAGSSEYSDPSGWTADYPSTWTVTSIPETSDGLGSGTTFSNLSPEHPDDPRLISLTITHQLDAQPDASIRSTPLPSSTDDFEVSPGASNARTLEFGLGGIRYLMTLSVGAQASSADIASVDRLVASIRPTGEDSSGAVPIDYTSPSGIGWFFSDVVAHQTADGWETAFRMSWENGVFPGERPCTVTVTGTTGDVIKTEPFTFESLQPVAERIVDTAEQPSGFDASCGERLDSPITYVISEPTLVIADDQVSIAFTVQWPQELADGSHPGTNQCLAALVSPEDATVAVTPFTLSVGPGSYAQRLDGVDQSEASGTTPIVRCEPFSGKHGMADMLDAFNQEFPQ